MENGIDIYQPILGLPILEWVTLYGYYILLPLMLLEGRVVGMIAAALANLGYLNVYIIWILLLSAGTISNIIYYFIGRSSSDTLTKHKLTKLFANRVRASRTGSAASSFFAKYGAKTFFLTKIVPSLSWPLQIAAGASHMNMKKYFTACLAADLVWGTLFVAIGYFMGYLAQKVNVYLVLGLSVLIIVSIFIFGRYLSNKFIRKETFNQI